MILREAQMSAPIEVWLRSRGYRVWVEVSFSYSRVDMVGAAFEPLKIVTVEMKTGFTRKVLRQAYATVGYVDECYAAAPVKPNKAALAFAARTGVGLLVVKDGQVTIAHPCRKPDEYSVVDLRCRERLAEKLQHMTEGGIAGQPMLKGIGPRQEVFARVESYRKTHPNAGWDEIFANVPNHYAHARSMRCVMSQWARCGVKP